ncbi:hypothetical protein HYFRA_00008319 [Hymenoscyphus fraxineus]|uniref:Transaldolase n=1 Tax=Hymenoscyphus fraxineus TaxID=746836 RepID=A0A9N9KQ63_9HELO|nr:hypothetical protein HYFRA_00008319 [Hymenoscyphus fraxineus]
MATKEKETMLQWLRGKSKVDCDTLDVEVAKSLGPFVDCTSNQAIAYNELIKPVHADLIKESVALSREIVRAGTYPGVGVKELGGEIAMLKLQHAIYPHLTGYIHIQTNPNHAYDTEKTILNAKRTPSSPFLPSPFPLLSSPSPHNTPITTQLTRPGLISLSQKLSPTVDTSRICIKIPSTWAGIQACRVLEKEGISTLATTLFVMEQVLLAGEVGCRYIAPYVNELRVHFEEGFIDKRKHKASLLCLAAQNYYASTNNTRTQVLPASLTHIDEVLALAGVHHITISPALLLELSQTGVEENKVASLFSGNAHVEGFETGEGRGGVYGVSKEGEERWEREFKEADGGEGGRKLGDAIRIFCEMQGKLEELMG